MPTDNQQQPPAPLVMDEATRFTEEDYNRVVANAPPAPAPDERDRAAAVKIVREYLGPIDHERVQGVISDIAFIIAAARAEGVAEGAADKARLDWLEQARADAIYYPAGGEKTSHWLIEANDKVPCILGVGEDLRAAINAARAEEGGER